MHHHHCKVDITGFNMVSVVNPESLNSLQEKRWRTPYISIPVKDDKTIRKPDNSSLSVSHQEKDDKTIRKPDNSTLTKEKDDKTIRSRINHLTTKLRMIRPSEVG